jgi:hypothetical protein
MVFVFLRVGVSPGILLVLRDISNLPLIKIVPMLSSIMVSLFLRVWVSQEMLF